MTLDSTRIRRARRFYEREGWTAAGEPSADPTWGLEFIECRRRPGDRG